MPDELRVDERMTRYTPDKGTVFVCQTCLGDGVFVAFDGNCPAKWAHHFCGSSTSVASHPAPTPRPEVTESDVAWFERNVVIQYQMDRECYERIHRILATYHAHAAKTTECEAGRQRLDTIVRRAHFALAGECPAYPGSAAACDPMACDCLSPAQDCTAEQTVELLVDAVTNLRAQLAAAQAEIDVLRSYGNKDCTAMADEVLDAARGEDNA